MNIWKYTQNGQTFGPVEIAQLQRLIDSGMLNGDSLLQKDGSSEWVPARNLPELNFATGNASASAPQPLPQAASDTSGPPPLSQEVPDAADIEKNKVFAILAYIGILFLVPLLAAPNSKFARYHANQGIVLFLATVILFVGSMVLALSPLACIMVLVPFLISIAYVVVMVIGIMNAANGQYKPLPYIGHFKILK